MKKTIFMLPALALMLFAACSSEDAVTKDNTAQLNETPENAIGFNAYLNRTVTRAGAPGILTTSTADATRVSLQGTGVGFGVFGYYADGDLYSENALPNFMYNQHVYYNSSEWKYEPVKYWPNEFGTSAVSAGVDRVTFFAYAPYVEVTPNTGQLTSQYDNTGGTEKSTTVGITSLTRNGKTGDPYVRYVGAFNPEECVDLCYGVAGENFVSSAGEGDGANDITMGQPYLNVAKPAIGSRINFLFKHALAQLKVNVDADVDIVGHDDGDNYTDHMTRVWIRSVTFNGIAPKGYFNLHTGYWYDAIDNEKISRASVTVYDKRRDGSEATAEDTYESPTGLNPNLVQSEVYGATFTNPGVDIQYGSLTLPDTKGVTAQNQYLFTGTGTVLVIPANEQMKVTIVYDVETADATLPTYLSDGKTKGSTVENKITKEITIGDAPLKLESGKSYTLNLHLGMTGVKFNATVSTWTDEPGEGNADLPANAPLASLGATSETTNSTNITVTADGVTDASFEVTGLNSEGSVPAPSKDGDQVTLGSSENLLTMGKFIQKFTVAANNKTQNKVGKVEVQQTTPSALYATLNITQLAHPLGLTVTTPANVVDNSSIVLGSSANMESADWTAATVTIFRTRNGITSKLTSDTDYDALTSNTITLKSAGLAQFGDTYSITVQSGDAAAETVSFTVGKKAGTLTYTPDPMLETISYDISESGFTSGSQTISVGGGEDGTVTYDIKPKNVAGGTSASINESTGAVTITDPVAGDEFTVIIKISDGTNYTYEIKEATYTITIVD